MVSTVRFSPFVFMESALTQIAKNLLDKIGIAVTSLCAIHCLLLPFLLPLLPMFGAEFLANELYEDILLISTMILGSFALYSGYKRYHNRLYPFVMLYVGGIIYWQKHFHGETLEPVIIAVGAGLVVLAHIVNMKLCRGNLLEHKCTDPQCC